MKIIVNLKATGLPMTDSTPLSQSLEDYLEAVYHIEQQKGAARPKDLADRLGVTAPSVTGALRALHEKGLVNYVPYDVVTLTARGRRRAKGVVRRHDALRDFFHRILSIEEKEADEAACRMEHAVPPVILDRIIHLVTFLEKCPLGGQRWLDEFAEFCKAGEFGDHCDQCLETFRQEICQRQEKDESEK